MSPSRTPPRFDPGDLAPGDRRHELAAIVALVRSQVVPPPRLAALIDVMGSAVALVQLSEDDRLFAVQDGSHDVVGAVTAEALAGAMRDVADWQRQGYDVRSVLDPTYPEALHQIFNRPPLLFVRGVWPAEAVPAVAIVGARKASDAGLQRARRLSRELSEAGYTIVSGLAQGVDTAAHTAALERAGARRGVTSAVMGTGPDRVYPAQNAGLAEQIVESGGALLSQFFPGQPPTQWTFPMRNVVMSGLAQATVVVEASETSGARMQARVALQHGRPVFLLRSLVQQHEWAQRYVAEGAYGTRAVEVATTQDVLDRLEGRGAEQSLLAVA